MSDARTSAFLAALNNEDAKLAGKLEKLAEEKPLHAFLARFDVAGDGSLNAEERALACRAIGLLARPSAKGLEMLTSAFDYLDTDANKVIEWDEMIMCVEILEMFCKADSVNDTLSQLELDMLLAVLAHLDTRGTGHLDEAARSSLRDALWTPNEFLEAQRESNPHLRRVLKLD